jgi:hypothetical protein
VACRDERLIGHWSAFASTVAATPTTGLLLAVLTVLLLLL